MSLFILIPLVLAVLIWSLNHLTPALSTQFLLKLQRRRAGLIDKRVTLPDGLTIVYSEGGTGENLLLLHGLGADRSSFETIAGLLTGAHHLIIPDLPGFGQSGQPDDGDYNIPAQVEHVDRFVSKLGLESFHLGGNSMGGWIAVAYAARYPAKVKSLWLLAAAGSEDMLETEAVKARQELGSYLLLARNRDEFDAVMRRIFFHIPFMPYCVRWAGTARAAAYFPLHSQIFDQFLENGRDYQVEPYLPDVKTPTLLAWGDQDHVVPVTVMQTFQRLMPNAKSALMENVGHVPQIEAPKQTADDYRRFRDALAHS